MYVWQHSAVCDGRLDQNVELLVATDGQLQVSWRNSFDFHLFARVAGQLEHFGSQVLENRRTVDGRRRTHSILVSFFLDVAMDSTNLVHREREICNGLWFAKVKRDQKERMVEVKPRSLTGNCRPAREELVCLDAPDDLVGFLAASDLVAAFFGLDFLAVASTGLGSLLAVSAVLGASLDAG